MKFLENRVFKSDPGNSKKHKEIREPQQYTIEIQNIVTNKQQKKN